jgi:D-xylose reductase
MKILKSQININIKLNNGYYMPSFGLGTFNVKNLEEIVYLSIKSGIRLFDTAFKYNNEKEVGLGIKRAINEGLVKREELFIISKIFTPMKHKVEEAIKISLNDLQLDYVDLYLDHWPYSTYLDNTTGKIIHTPLHIFWPQMEDIVYKGYTKSIGVSNYKVQLLANLLSFAKIKPVVNEFELNPLHTQEELVKYCKSNDIQVIAYNSLGRGIYIKKFMTHEINLLENKVILKYAEKYQTTPGIILLNWALRREYIVIPSTSNPERINENLKSLTLSLNEDEIEEIDSLNIDASFNNAKRQEWANEVDILA